MKKGAKRKPFAEGVSLTPPKGEKRVACMYRPPHDFFPGMAAERGGAEEQYELGRLCFFGAPQQSAGVSFTDAFQPDHARAALWLQKAADQGHAEAASLLEVVRAQGKGVH